VSDKDIRDQLMTFMFAGGRRWAGHNDKDVRRLASQPSGACTHACRSRKSFVRCP
jgi:hypothetical protein